MHSLVYSILQLSPSILSLYNIPPTFYWLESNLLKRLNHLLPSSQMSENTRTQGSIIGTCALAFISVCLRYYARKISKAGFWYDDWLIVPATVSIS